MRVTCRWYYRENFHVDFVEWKALGDHTTEIAINSHNKNDNLTRLALTPTRFKYGSIFCVSVATATAPMTFQTKYWSTSKTIIDEPETVWFKSTQNVCRNRFCKLINNGIFSLFIFRLANRTLCSRKQSNRTESKVNLLSHFIVQFASCELHQIAILAIVCFSFRLFGVRHTYTGHTPMHTIRLSCDASSLRT